MKQIAGLWLPDSDEHFKPHLKAGPIVEGKGTYQYRKYVAAKKYIKKYNHAVDVGGHIGTWSRVMAKDFKRVTAFEPLEEHQHCFVRNVEAKNVTLVMCALGAAPGRINIHMPHDNTGHAHVSNDGEDCEIVTLDSMGIEQIDLLKIDVEGFEYEVIIGAETTIRSTRPVIVVEQKIDSAERYGRGRWDAVGLLKSWGMKEVKVISGDHIMVW